LEGGACDSPPLYLVTVRALQVTTRLLIRTQRPILNFARRDKLLPPGAKLSPRVNFFHLGDYIVIPWG
jgi:hypothetical protein